LLRAASSTMSTHKSLCLFCDDRVLMHSSLRVSFDVNSFKFTVLGKLELQELRVATIIYFKIRLQFQEHGTVICKAQ